MPAAGENFLIHSLLKAPGRKFAGFHVVFAAAPGGGLYTAN